MAGLDAGTLDRRVTLRRSTLGTDGYGDPKATFPILATVRASVRFAPGTERLASAENAATAPVVIRIRWSTIVADLNTKDRIEYPVGSGKMLDIVSVNEIGIRDTIEIAAVGRDDQ